MILLHSPEVELSRALLATMPEGCTVIEGSGGHAVSAYPSVVVDVPAYIEKRQAINEAGEMTGMEDVSIPSHEEVLRMPASWAAVQSFVDFVESRANS
jgi:hypothetical protein